MEYKILKENDLFIFSDQQGDIPLHNDHGYGLYRNDTRFLSVMELKICGQKPICLSSEFDENYKAKFILTNPHIQEDDEVVLWRESIELDRTRFVYKNVLFENLKITNYHPVTKSFQISYQFDADFQDMFIVRKFLDGETGNQLESLQIPKGRTLRYLGKDGLERLTQIHWSCAEKSVTNAGEVVFELQLDPLESIEIEFQIVPVIGTEKYIPMDTKVALTDLRQSYLRWMEQSTGILSDSPSFNEMYLQGLLDLKMLLTDLGHGEFPVAGVPWFAVPFGRDSIIAALQMLPVNTSVAKGTLRTMAHYQGKVFDTNRDEQPGKIMHELRSGELAATRQIPFTPYYGTIDATPLFVILFCEYIKWTDDFEEFKGLLPAVSAALDWIDDNGDRDGDGFVEYVQEADKGIRNQGWKDSENSIVHRDGEFANAPIALVEVQGYVYQAKMELSQLLKNFATKEENSIWTTWSERLQKEAQSLKESFEEKFWMKDERFYALALDKDKRQVQPITSNVGHLLMSGMISDDRARAVAEVLLSPKLFSGYGIRTMAADESAYNPMSYHNGSVWPHDNSLCLLGLTEWGFMDEARKLMNGLIRSAKHFDNSRLPELFCGYSADHSSIVQYPIACSPQAWAAATPLSMIKSILGLRLDFGTKTIRLNPNFPDGMTEIKVTNLRVSRGVLSLVIRLKQGEYVLDSVSNTSGWNIEF